MASARIASRRSTAHSGTSLSHSISVGSAPAWLITDLIELPHRIGDRTIMGVDQQQVAFIVGILRVAGKMDLLDQFERKVAQILHWFPAMVGSGNKNIVDVEQQTATGFPGDFTDEIPSRSWSFARKAT
jgi:hypothetical protein